MINFLIGLLLISLIMAIWIKIILPYFAFYRKGQKLDLKESISYFEKLVNDINLEK